MKMVMLGHLDPDDVKDLGGQPLVILRGAPEELRELAPLLFREVKVVSAPDTSGGAHPTESTGESDERG